jgi:23S rRNA (pseudouridine1915-N3)-methyltransferase
VFRITVVAIGKDKDPWVSDGIAHYTTLLSRWAAVEIVTPNARTSPSLSPAEIKRAEAAALRRYVESGVTIALSDSGRPYDSPAFASFLQQLQTTSGGRVVFLIGGPYGLDDSILSAATFVVSLSPLTFSHQIVRLILMEQLYRGLSIQHGTDYHK